VVGVCDVSAAEAALSALLLAVAAATTLTDLRERRIPNRVTGPAAVAAVAIGCALDLDGEPVRLAAGAAAAVFLGVAALLNPAGMGLGDAKLAGVIGLCLGRTTLVALAVALGAGTAYGLVKVLREGRAARRATVPFGPFLALGALGGVISLLAA